MSARTSAVIACLFVVPAVHAQKIYWTDSGTDKIQRANLDGSDVEDLVSTGLTSPRPIFVDQVNQKVYWADGQPFTSKIQRADLDGTNVEDLFIASQHVDGIAVDFNAGKIYWTRWLDKSNGILRADLDGSNVEILVNTASADPLGIALDIDAGKMYWTLNGGTDKIQRANLDGSNIEILVTAGLDVPFGIGLDIRGGKMYWSDFGTGKIQRANLDGSNVQDLVTSGLSQPMGIALDLSGRKIYWTDPGTDKIERGDLDGSNVEDVVATGLQTARGIALHVPPPPIPTLSEWGVAALAAFFLLFGIMIINRRNSKNRSIASPDGGALGNMRGFHRPRSRASYSCIIVVGTVSLCLASRVVAQPAEMPVRIIEVNVDSGIVSASGPGNDAVVVFSRAVSVLDAPWVRLHFQQVQFSGSREADNESFLRITSGVSAASGATLFRIPPRWGVRSESVAPSFMGGEDAPGINLTPGINPGATSTT